MDTDGGIPPDRRQIVILAGGYGMGRAAIQRLLDLDLSRFGFSVQMQVTGERVDPLNVSFVQDSIHVALPDLNSDYFQNDQSRAARRERAFSRRTRTDGWEHTKRKDK